MFERSFEITGRKKTVHQDVCTDWSSLTGCKSISCSRYSSGRIILILIVILRRGGTGRDVTSSGDVGEKAQHRVANLISLHTTRLITPNLCTGRQVSVTYHERLVLSLQNLLCIRIYNRFTRKHLSFSSHRILTVLFQYKYSSFLRETLADMMQLHKVLQGKPIIQYEDSSLKVAYFAVGKQETHSVHGHLQQSSFSSLHVLNREITPNFRSYSNHKCTMANTVSSRVVTLAKLKSSRVQTRFGETLQFTVLQ